MDTERPLGLLGGRTAAQFMRTHWQKKPLLVRQALPGFRPLLARAELLRLVVSDAVESRLVTHFEGRWRLRHGPMPRRSLPAVSKPGWTVLLQGMDLQSQSVHELMQQFRFVPDARLDDLMISFASDQGGVGAHVDQYDVFLLQADGRRRWRIGWQEDRAFQPGMPLRVLQRFRPQEEYVLEPGDLLYLPPLWAHEGVALGPCMTYSVGFRSPSAVELGRTLLAYLSDHEAGAAADPVYGDPEQPATATPAAIPETLQAFARSAVLQRLSDPGVIDQALGQWLSEPKPSTWFDAATDCTADLDRGVTLDRRSRMLYAAAGIYINGEHLVPQAADQVLLERLANQRRLDAQSCARLSVLARQWLLEWMRAGWLHACD